MQNVNSKVLDWHNIKRVKTKPIHFKYTKVHCSLEEVFNWIIDKVDSRYYMENTQDNIIVGFEDHRILTMFVLEFT